MIYWAVRGAAAALCRLLFRFEIKGPRRLPETGGYIIAPVHRSYIDTFIAASLTKRRPVRYMGKSSYIPWWFAPLAHRLGAFPVDHDRMNRESVKKASEFLADGTPVVIFPEGTRRTGHEVVDLFEGVTFIAARAKVPVYPVGIAGTERAMPRGSARIRRTKVVAVIGEPLEFEGGGRSAVRDSTERLRVALQEVFDESRSYLEGGASRAPTSS